MKGPQSFDLCDEGEIEEGGRKKFVVHGNEVMLVRIDGKIVAVEPLCTHDGTDISRSKYDPIAGTLECSKHFAVFDIRSGTPIRGPFGADGDTQPPLRLYKVKIEAGRIKLEAKQDWGVITPDK